MEQHPVPQDITGFKFKLVGDMTLKQFGELAFGAIVAYIFYSTGWPGFIKMPLVIIFGILGFALAFFPIEERPLDIWIVNFLKAIYKPTLYVWQKGSGTLLYSSGSAIPQVTTSAAPTPVWTKPAESTPPLTPPTRVSPIPAPQPAAPAPTPTPPPQATPVKPPEPPPAPATQPSPLSIEDLQSLRDQKKRELEEAVNEVRKIQKKVETPPATPPEPQVVTIDSLALARDQKKQEEENKIRELIKQNTDIITQIETVKTKIQALQGMDTSQLQQQLNSLSSQKDNLTAQITSLQETTASPFQPGQLAPQAEQPTDLEGVRVVERPMVRQATVSLTDLPNVINGLVVNDRGVPLDSSILIVKDKDGNSIRALKSNQVGQFIASTPLENGTYYLEFERPGYTFETLELTLSGKVIAPIEVRAQPVAQSAPVPSVSTPIGVTNS